MDSLTAMVSSQREVQVRSAGEAQLNTLPRFAFSTETECGSVLV